jgi:hypothetical protein
VRSTDDLEAVMTMASTREPVDAAEVTVHPLTAAELAGIDALLGAVLAEYDAPDSAAFLADAATVAQELPRGVRRFLNDMRLRDTGLFSIAGYHVDDEAIGPTPAHWRTADGTPVRREEFLLLMYTSLLGEPYSMSVLQGGRLVNEVIPIKGQETTVTAGSSEQDLQWHTEEAGFEVRPDYQCFVSMRNPDRVPTTVAHVSWLALDTAIRRVLAEPRFVVAPWGEGSGQRLRLAPLFGGVDTPYIRFDPVYTTAEPGDAEAAAALSALITAVERALRPLRHAPGDFFFIDNWRVVHGRDAYAPRYDGSDRWLKRVKAARNFRASRHLRESAVDRIVYLDQLYA